MKIKHSICSDDGKLLKLEALDEMFSPQLDYSGVDNMLVRIRNFFTGGSKLEPGKKVNYGLAGLLISKEGILKRSEQPKLYGAIDRVKKISSLYASNIVP
jgi:hypothetical protein